MESTPAPAAATGAARIEARASARLNLADHQNAVPVLHELCIANDSPDTLRDLTLELASSPAFVKPRMWQVDAVAPGARFEVAGLDLELDAALLSRLSEAEPAQLVWRLLGAGGPPAGDGVPTEPASGPSVGRPPREIARLELPLELLPRNHWGGLAGLPEMVAAFVQPNEPAVERLLKEAAELLRRHGRDAALDGYRGGAARAWEMASALWSAVAAMGIDYALPPASFEHAGQKVRGPQQIADARLATCLDLALLFAAALEQCGLNPVLVFTQGHALAGLWLQPEGFASAVVDDASALRKRVRLKELVLFETTLVTRRPAPAFSLAIERGAQRIAEAAEASFELAIDVRRARLRRIRPLASGEAPPPPDAGAQPAPQLPQSPDFEAAPELPQAPPGADAAPARPEDRLLRWQRKLLDLSLRNGLLNFRPGKKTLRLEAPEPARLEDLLAAGRALRLRPRPALMDGAEDPRSAALHEARTHEDPKRAQALDALARGEVLVELPEEELEARLVDLYRSARTMQQEGGANTLFLALGFLSWTRDAKDDRRHRAPLVLVPVTLERRSVRSGFSLALHDDEPRFNPTLLEMLRQDFRLDLGIDEGALPKDERGLDIARVWRTVSAAVRDIRGWEVVEDVVLSSFSFAKHLMWKDLAERIDQLRHNAVVRHLIDTPRDPYRGPAGAGAFPEPRRLDEDCPPERTFCPLPADSSQLSAVMAASAGRDFVLIGPPGTGKSQTIANVIAQCLAEGRRVLFVSEKIAALDVVHRRLRDAGLGDFCLELHSSKARKTEVLGQLRRSWEAGGRADPETWRAEARRLMALRGRLNRYVERLHHRHANGLSVFDAIGRREAGRELPALGLAWASPDVHDAEALENLRRLAERLDVHAQALGGAPQAHPLAAVRHGDWSPSWQQGLLDAAQQVADAAPRLEASARALCEAAGLPVPPLHRRGRQALGLLAQWLPLAAGRDWRFALRPDARAICGALDDARQRLLRHRELVAQLSAPWPAEALDGLRHGARLVARRRELIAQLSQPWPAALRDALAKGVGLLQRHGELERQLSVGYGAELAQLDVLQLQRDWQRAALSPWPLRGWRQGRIRARLAALVQGVGEPDLAADLPRLASMRLLQAEIAALDAPAAAAGGLWAGLRSRLDELRAAIVFQTALAAAREGQPWDERGLDAVVQGHCGAAMSQDLTRMYELRRLDAELARLEPLRALQGGFWEGPQTRLDRLEAVLALQSALAAAASGAPWCDEGLAIEPGEGWPPALAADLRRLRELRALEPQIAAHEALGASTATWAGLKSRPEEIDAAIRFANTLAAALAQLAATPDAAAALKAPLARLLGEADALLHPAGAIAGAARDYLQAYGALQQALERFAAATGSPAGSAVPGEAPPAELAAQAGRILGSRGRLRDWCAWRKAREEAFSSGLAPLAAAIEQGGVAPGGARELFEADYCRWWLDAVVDGDEVLRGFVSAEHERRIEEFRALDERFAALTRDWVHASLCAGRPAPGGVERASEWGVLRHEMQKKSRHLPLRELLARIPEALARLAPCMLMSPLSVAQYLSPASAFDVVVFDEASQIPPWDAIGAIARARQVVMVGDPKQLPPTSFFNRAAAEPGEDEVGAAEEADLESILDECLGANLPTLNLRWHYRSRSESLIAFSNHRYYGGALVTFPSPATEDRAVSLHPVDDGVYEKGGARTNVAEARALVADLLARLRSPDFRAAGRSIGVVTFNAEQQGLIEDLLDDARRKDPLLEPFFDEAALEPVFVKNLESVQGDERDLMYFSVTYGPGRDGALSMNFGPLNRQGGERRLNVAITRARHELRVFASLAPEQMDLSRTQAHGVRDLKHFLEFAARGPRALGESVRGSVGGFDSPFEQAVAAALAGRGWRVQPQVGVSSFRIDLGVVDPDAPGAYLAGIECDGATYHRSATARDRDKLREQVLRGLGWEIVRIWSTDWWIDREGTLEKVQARLESLLAARRAARSSQAAPGDGGGEETCTPSDLAQEQGFPGIPCRDKI